MERAIGVEFNVQRSWATTPINMISADGEEKEVTEMVMLVQ